MKLNKSIKKELKPWSVKSSRVILEDHWIKLRVDDCLTSDAVAVSPYYVLEYPSWVHMVVMNDKNQILITEQYRHGAGTIFFELPCGTQDAKDKNPLEAARRELLEEVGYKGDFILAGETSPNPASHANWIYTFLVMNPMKVSQPQENPKEIMNYQFIDLERIFQMIDKGKFQQALHISSLTLGLRKKDIDLSVEGRSVLK